MGSTLWYRIRSILTYNPLSTKNSTSVQESKIEWNSKNKNYFWQEKKSEGYKEFLSNPRDFCLAYNTLYSQQVHKVLAIYTVNTPKENTVIF